MKINAIYLSLCGFDALHRRNMIGWFCSELICDSVYTGPNAIQKNE